MTRAHLAATVLTLAALTGAYASGCTSPGGAPCADPSEAERCPVGYVCVKERIFVSDREVCRKADAKNEGQVCAASEECRGFTEGVMVCADMQRRCPTGSEAACDLRCRPTCQSHFQCGPDQICWPGGGSVPGVCQEGECGETAIDCPGGLRCLWFKPGPTAGVCYPECDVLRQAECNQNPPPQDARCCAPQEACIHFAANPATATCLPVGTARLAENCDTEQTAGLPSCLEGLFCTDLLASAAACPNGNCLGVCTQYCNRGGGAPACDRAGALCKAFATGNSLQWGYCE